MKIRKGNLSDLIICFFLVTTLSNLLTSCEFLREQREDDFGIPIKLLNKTNDNMLVIIFPIVISPEEVLEESSVKQVRLTKESSDFVRYYLGKKVNLKNVIISTIAWKTSSDSQISSGLNYLLFQEPPYLVKTFYDPKFEIGPEKYGIFATLVIE